MPLVPRPFLEVAKNLGMTEEEVLATCSRLLEKGAIRRFGPSLAHRKLGFDANPMSVLKVPEDMLEDVGTLIAKDQRVTHCYARSGWDYNLFFMVHAKTREEGSQVAEEIIRRTGVKEYRLLFSKKELKKVPFEISKEAVA